ncbi:unnamed protein product, partial [Brenthis ino]
MVPLMVSQKMNNKCEMGDDTDDKCIPFVSEYSDCSDANACSGCTRCTCSAEGEWDCQLVFECPTDDKEVASPESVSVALDVLYSELKNKEKNEKKQRVLVPPPPKPEDELLVSGPNPYQEDFATYLSRQKRSISDQSEDNESKNHTIKFHHTVDELNEDTLKNSNKSGTIQAMKVESNILPKISRRTDLLNNQNKSSLHIEYNQPEEYDHHIAENKIEIASHNEKIDARIKDKLNKFTGNYTQNIKDSDLSKLVVNELKRGTEIIGNANVKPMSNITFTLENDTLTAMAFIAGNLLNKLWDIEQDTSNGFIETEVLKHEKINDLLELFKEPLNIRQETFLKNALDKLSNTLNKNKNVKNISLCETIAIEMSSGENLNNNNQVNKINNSLCTQKEQHTTNEIKEMNVSTEVLQKLNNVLSLIKKFERVQKSLNALKHQAVMKESDSGDALTIDENSSLHLFGNLLEKITKLLIPNNSSKKIRSKIKNLNQFSGKDSQMKVVGEHFNVDLSKYNLTIKDKLILDYLNHIENNPHCLLNKNIPKLRTQPKNNVGGNINYNLSEFLKIKSFMDLLNLTKNDERSGTPIDADTEAPSLDTTTKAAFLNNSLHRLNNTKEKLKNHLKAIIDDLIELQNDNTYFKQNKINITDALPCIYNILNADKLIANKTLPLKSNVSPLDRIKTLIDSMKLEFTSTSPTRRSGLAEERTQSAKVWERVVKNINSFQKKTRRTLAYEKPKTYQELKDMIENIESTGNSYKNFALLSVIPPHKRLMLLKTLEADTKQQALVLENIRKSTNNLNNLPLDKLNELQEFIDNAQNNINLSIKVLQNVVKSKQNVNNEPVNILNRNKNEQLKVPELLKNTKSMVNNNVKLTRDQILIQLIENRIKLYINSKESKYEDMSNDINYNIGKRVLTLIRNGNIDVAKELFKIFIANQREESNKMEDKASIKGGKLLQMPLNEPLRAFENTMESQDSRSKMSPDQLFKQLLKVKNMNSQYM